MKSIRQEAARDILANALLTRKRRNYDYGLRALARDLDLLPSRVSEYLAEKRPIPEAVIEALPRQLALSNEERQPRGSD